MSQREERAIVRMVKNSHLSAPKITVEVERICGKSVSEDTVRRTLYRSGNHGQVARRKPFISKKNKRKRLEFAKQYLQKGTEYWEDVIFTDESKFNLFGSDGRFTVWRKTNEELLEKNVCPTVKHGGGSVMVWGCVSSKGVGNLDFVQGTMNKDQYLQY